MEKPKKTADEIRKMLIAEYAKRNGGSAGGAAPGVFSSTRVDTNWTAAWGSLTHVEPNMPAWTEAFRHIRSLVDLEGPGDP